MVTLPVTVNVEPLKVKFGSEFAVFAVPFAVNTLLSVVGEIELNPVPEVPLVPLVPFVPFVPDVPLAPEVPFVPDDPFVPFVPEVPFAPLVPLVHIIQQ